MGLDGGTSSNEGKVGSEERARAVAEALARRSFPAVVGPPLLAGLLAWFIPGNRDIHDLLLAMVGLGLCRLWISLRHPVLFARSPGRWRALFRACAIVTALVWGIYAGLITTTTDGGPGISLILLMTAGIAAGATVSLSPDVLLVRSYLTILLVPPCVALVLADAPFAWPRVLCIVLFSAFMLVQANLLHTHFHAALDAERLLSAQARELRLRTEAANEARAEAETANSAKSTFLANMSHELRTPLSAILGYADLLLGRISEKERIEYANVVRRNGDHLLTLLNDLLDLSKIEADKMSVAMQDVSVRGVLEDVVSLMRVRAEERGLKMHVLADVPFPRTIRADPTRLRQILLNLVGNAVKFTDEGEVRIRLRVVDDPRRLFVDIEDTGPGLSEEQQSKLFKAFAQSDTPSSAPKQGTGLGLHISRKLARLMNGDVELQSQLGQGSVFSLWLPLGAGENQLVTDLLGSIRPQAPGEEQATTLLAGMRVLVADDGPDNQRLFKAVLSMVGAEVEIAQNGEQAVAEVLGAEAEGRRFDVVLMDMDMPKLDGYGATARLRAAGYTGPIVALTAHAMATHRQRTLAAGCDAHLVKPIERRVLIDTVHALRVDQGATVAETPRAQEPPAALYSSLLEDPMLAPLLPGYIESMARMRGELARAHSDDDRKRIAMLSHQLAGTAGSYGFDAITDAARVLERLAHESTGDLDAALDALVTLCDRAVNTQRALPKRESA